MDNYLTTILFIGIDVSSKSNYVFTLGFFGKKLLSFKARNNLPSSQEIVSKILQCLNENNLHPLKLLWNQPHSVVGI